jgi:hypothetical protein
VGCLSATSREKTFQALLTPRFSVNVFCFGNSVGAGYQDVVMLEFVAASTFC